MPKPFFCRSYVILNLENQPKQGGKRKQWGSILQLTWTTKQCESECEEQESSSHDCWGRKQRNCIKAMSLRAPQSPVRTSVRQKHLWWWQGNIYLFLVSWGFILLLLLLFRYWLWYGLMNTHKPMVVGFGWGSSFGVFTF